MVVNNSLNSIVNSEFSSAKNSGYHSPMLGFHYSLSQIQNSLLNQNPESNQKSNYSKVYTPSTSEILDLLSDPVINLAYQSSNLPSEDSKEIIASQNGSKIYIPNLEEVLSINYNRPLIHSIHNSNPYPLITAEDLGVGAIKGEKFNYFFENAYLYNPRPDIEGYMVLPLNVTIHRVPQYELGEGVLGRTWTNTGLIQILDSLQGEQFLEVAIHELEHNLYPEATESMIRKKTSEKLWFAPTWHK